MLHFYFLSSVLTVSLTYTLFSFYGAQYFLNSTQGGRKERVKPHVVPVYMWDIYNNGVNSTEIDVIRGIYPIFAGNNFNSDLYRNHRVKQLKFEIPKAKKSEILIKTEIKLTINSPKNQTVFFQIYLKNEKWVFLDEKKVSDVSTKWISLRVTSKNQPLKTGSVTFLILTLCQNYCQVDILHPVLILSYKSNGFKRRKRSSGMEDYEEETNNIWGNKFLLQEGSRMRNSCRRKPLYVDFSDIEYDSWIVAPSGYEAFQCVGRCSFPISEHLTPTKHAIIQTIVHNTSPRKTSRACCVPTRLDPISILYVDENGVLTYRFKYRDMVVSECGCR